MKSLEINANVRIKLTKLGIKTLEERNERFREELHSAPPPKIDEKGFCEMPLWQVMQIFGKYMHMGATELPFDSEMQIV